ncbi:MAG: rRNA maturation RNase YbeY [Pseudomonadales bacterium]
MQLVTAIPTPAAAAIRRWAQTTLERAPRADGGRLSAAPAEVCVRVVDEAEMRQLNRDYRHQDRPTNVLSFPAAIELPDSVVWGDVVVCAPVVAAEAEVQNKAYADHFAHMVVHGVLHLLGYDH